MIVADKIIAEIYSRWGQDPAAKICADIIQYILHADIQQSRMLTYHDLGHLTGCNPEDELLTRTVAILTGRFNVLSINFVFFDDEGEKYYLDPQEKREFIKTHVVVHPRTGELVADADSHTYPYFSGDKEALAQEVEA